MKIVDSKGPDYYNEQTVYDTEEAAEVALTEAQEWARLRIEEVQG